MCVFSSHWIFFGNLLWNGLHWIGMPYSMNRSQNDEPFRSHQLCPSHRGSANYSWPIGSLYLWIKFYQNHTPVHVHIVYSCYILSTIWGNIVELRSCNRELMAWRTLRYLLSGPSQKWFAAPDLIDDATEYICIHIIVTQLASFSFLRTFVKMY